MQNKQTQIFALQSQQKTCFANSYFANIIAYSQNSIWFAILCKIHYCI